MLERVCTAILPTDENFKEDHFFQSIFEDILPTEDGNNASIQMREMVNENDSKHAYLGKYQ